MDLLERHIEALIFTAENFINLQEIQSSLGNCLETSFAEDEILKAIDGLMVRYQDPLFAMEIREMAGGYCFMTKPFYHQTVGAYLKLNHFRRLSRAALETLSIVAYKQPITRIEIESIRGVNCEYTLQKLLEKELVEIEGRSDSPGRPLIYRTGIKFMDHFGIKSLKDLPKLKEISSNEHSIGEQAPIEEDVPHISSESEEE